MAHPYQQQHVQAQTYQTAYPVSSRYISHSTLAIGGLGAMIGATAATAKNIQRVSNEEITRQEAVKDVLKEAAGTGLATAAAAAAVHATGARGLLSLVGVLAVATGAKYVWNSAIGAEK